MNKSEECNPQKAGQVPTQLSVASKNLSVLEDQISQLFDRLLVVMRVCPEEVSKCVEPPELVEVAEQIHLIACRISHQNERISAILELLEL